MAYVYILECRDGSFYVGSTTDLGARINQHDLGLAAAYTRSRRPVRLVWAVEFESIREAFAFEKRIQGWGRAKRLALIEGRPEDLPALSVAYRDRRPLPSTTVVEEVAQQPSRDQGETPC